jgi:hypothetical protein
VKAEMYKSGEVNPESAVALEFIEPAPVQK